MLYDDDELTYLTHLTLTFGEAVGGVPIVYDAAVRQAAEEIVRTGRGKILSSPDWYAEIIRPRNPPGRGPFDAAFFEISSDPDMSKPSIIMSMVCWAEAVSEITWQAMLDGYAINRVQLTACGMWRDPPDTPPETPWIATWFTPHIVPLMSGNTTDNIVAAEQHLALALIRQARIEDRHRVQ